MFQGWIFNADGRVKSTKTVKTVSLHIKTTQKTGKNTNIYTKTVTQPIKTTQKPHKKQTSKQTKTQPSAPFRKPVKKAYAWKNNRINDTIQTQIIKTGTVRTETIRNNPELFSKKKKKRNTPYCTVVL